MHKGGLSVKWALPAWEVWGPTTQAWHWPSPCLCLPHGLYSPCLRPPLPVYGAYVLEPRRPEKLFEVFSVRSDTLSPHFQEIKSSLEEDLMNQNDKARFQIRCGRCQITAQPWLKLHLLSSTWRRKSGPVARGSRHPPCSRAAQGELTKQAAPFWNVLREGSCSGHHPFQLGVLCSPQGPKRQLYLYHQNDMETLTKQEQASKDPVSPGRPLWGPRCPAPRLPSPAPLWL